MEGGRGDGACLNVSLSILLYALTVVAKREGSHGEIALMLLRQWGLGMATVGRDSKMAVHN